MSQVSRTLRKTVDGYAFLCPGCKSVHCIWVDSRDIRPGAQWSFNGNVDKPTFQPSLLIKWTEPAAIDDIELLNQQTAEVRAGRIDRIPKVDRVCHSFITDGNIQFLGDCTHELANQTVPIPDFPHDSWGDGSEM